MKEEAMNLKNSKKEWEDLEGGRGKEKWCDYMIISKKKYFLNYFFNL